jgi:uncharacterized membrane protein required for colicin V production
MSSLDLVVITVLLYTTWRGASRGLVSQLAWIVALIACFAFAKSFSLKLAPLIAQNFPQIEPPLDRWISMFILYMGFAFVSFGVARVLRGWLEKAKFDGFDKHLGGLFGLVKGVVICLVGIFFAVTLSSGMRETVLASHSGHAAAVIMQRLAPVMPNELAGVIEKAQQHLNHDDFHKDHLDGEESGFDDFIDRLPDFGSGQGNQPEHNVSGFAEQDGFVGEGIGAERDTSNSGGGTPSGITLTDIIRKLPSSIGNDIKNRALNALRNASPEQQRNLSDQLRSLASNQFGDQSSQQVNSVLKNWISKTEGDSSSSFDSLPSTNDPPIANNNNRSLAIIQQTLKQIGEIYSDHTEAQRDFTNSITEKLDGVPTQVQAAVLQDWYADLMPGQTDPDPETVLRTQLDIRILRQLQAANISPTRLSSQLQQRLNDARR